MLPKIFILLAIVINPQGQVLTLQQGQFPTEKTCELASKDLLVRAQVNKVPSDKLMLVCAQTKWTVPGARGA